MNGWLQYAHANQVRRDSQGNLLVSGVTASAEQAPLPYRLSNTPITGWRQIEAIPYRRWLRRSGAIYVMRRD